MYCQKVERMYCHRTWDVEGSTGLRGIKLKLTGTIDFDLDPKTFKTLRAVANSQGSISIEVTEVSDEPVQESRIRGKTVMTLVASKG